MRQEEMIQMLKNHQTALYGNGRPGLIETIAAVNASVRGMESGLARLMEMSVETKDQVTKMSAKEEMTRQAINEALAGIRKSQESHAELVEGWVVELKTMNNKEHEMFSARITPLEKFNEKYVYTAAAISGATFLLGAVLMFIVANWENLLAMLKAVK
jgi:hypothetical protein